MQAKSSRPELTGSAAGAEQATSVVRQAGERRSARIESLRALAALGVLVGHAYGWAHHWGGVYATYRGRVVLSGGFGVFLFFTLSGYLLYLPFARSAFGDGDRIRVGRYAANRALRVLPLYYVVVATFLALDGAGVRSQWWRYALFVENFSGQTFGKIDGPVWSLVVEVQFYVLLPLFAWAVASVARRSLPRGAVLVGALGVGALVLRLATVTTAGAVSPLWRYSLPATCVFFFPGFLLAQLRVHLDNSRRSWAAIPFVGSATVWFAGGVVLWLVVAYRYSYDGLLLVASALLLGACTLPLRAELPVRLLDMRWIAGLGAASYSLYLWHDPIVEALSRSSWMPGGFVPLLAASLVVCALVAVASYRVVEQPFLRRRRSWSHSRLPEGMAGGYAPDEPTRVQDGPDTQGIIGGIPAERNP